jgi:curved DNA-binding protein
MQDMEYKDYYQTLGVSRDVDEKELRKAFRRLARKYHPDVNPNDPEAEERFKEINEAYEVLADSEKRQKYDQLGAEWNRYQQTGGRPGDFDWGRWQSGAPGEGQRVHVRYGTPEDLQDLFGGGSSFSDFFGQIFGGMRGASPGNNPGGFEYQARPQRGRDVEQEVEISLQEAYHGTTRVFDKDGRHLRVKIPPGARSGTRIRLMGEGTPGTAGGPAGNLYLRARVLPDPRFERQGDDLNVTVPVDLYTAILGGQTPVPTLDGAIKLTIPAGTQNGQRFRLRGKGMPHMQESEGQGDLYAHLDVRLPTEVTAKQQELLKELQRMSEQGE